ncbi:hypothetical protein IFR05_013158 [Cadophora sp. M221]|nr:hypothetical protein IFR05_013158 [Cadophora sp. M221]
MATSERPAKDSFQQQLRVVIGEAKTEIFVQKSMVCEQSEFFKSACNPHWETGKTNTIALEEEDPIIFSIFLNWIYTGDIQNNEDYISIDEKPTPSAATLKSHWMQLVQCFTLGEMLMATNFKNAIIDLLFSKTDLKYLRTSWLSMLDIDIIEQVFIGTPQAMGDFLEDSDKLGMKSVQQFIGMKLKFKCPWEQKNRREYHEHPGKQAGYLCTNKFPKVKNEVEAKKVQAQNPPPAPIVMTSSAQRFKSSSQPTKKLPKFRTRQ